MKLKHTLVLAVSATVLLFSCVSSKKYKATQAQDSVRYDNLNKAYLKTENDLNALKDSLQGRRRQTEDMTRQNASLEADNDNLRKQIDFLKQNNNQVLNQLKDLSVISSSQAESIKKSMDNIGAKDAYIQDLQASIARKDSVNMALVMNLKGAIGNLDDKDINIKVDKGVVYIDISDKLLFKSGNYDITDQAKEVLGKVAKVLKNQPDIEFMVEGHTDSVPYHGNGALLDNWDLSVKRATTVVRLLQNTYGLDPAHITAAGRSQYVPVADNTTADGRAANRRTRIVILPQLDQFFKLLEKKN